MISNNKRLAKFTASVDLLTMNHNCIGPRRIPTCQCCLSLVKNGSHVCVYRGGGSRVLRKWRVGANGLKKKAVDCSIGLECKLVSKYRVGRSIVDCFLRTRRRRCWGLWAERLAKSARQRPKLLWKYSGGDERIRCRRGVRLPPRYHSELCADC
jgi:hypothetical protein